MSTTSPTLRRPGWAGGAAALAAPILAIVALLVSAPKEEAADRVEAVLDHHGAVIASLGIDVVAQMLFIGAAVWLTVALAPRVGSWVRAAGVLVAFGFADLLFVGGMEATTPRIVSGVADHAQAVALVDHVTEGPAGSALEPLSVTTAIGFVLFAIALVKAGAPRWTAVATGVGGIATVVGFATGVAPIAIASFVLHAAAFVRIVPALAAGSSLGRPAAHTAAAVPALD